MNAEPHRRRVVVRAAILVFFVGVQLLDGALTYINVGAADLAVEQKPLLAWSMGIFCFGATVATTKIVAVACGVVLLSRFLRDRPFSSPPTMSRSWMARH